MFYQTDPQNIGLEMLGENILSESNWQMRQIRLHEYYMKCSYHLAHPNKSVFTTKSFIWITVCLGKDCMAENKSVRLNFILLIN